MLCNSHQPPDIPVQTLYIYMYIAVKADLNVYSALVRLAHLISQSDCNLVLLFMPVLASNFLILAHGRQNIDKLFLVNLYLPGCCIAKLASRRRHLFVLCTRVWKLSIAVQCCQNVDNILPVNDVVFVAKGYEHIWASSSHRLKWTFCGCLNDVEARAYMRTASYAPASGTPLKTDFQFETSPSITTFCLLSISRFFIHLIIPFPMPLAFSLSSNL